MNELKKIDYLKFIFHKTKIDLTRYNINNSDKELINNLFKKLIYSDNLFRDLYILSNIKELKNIGKYFIFILKKIDDNVINFTNLSQNINTDTEFIENEILNYLSNPKLREDIQLKYTEEITEQIESSDEVLTDEIVTKEGETYDEAKEIEKKHDIDEEKEILSFKKNYLELIQSEANEGEELVYELPKIEDEQKEKEKEQLSVDEITDQVEVDDNKEEFFEIKHEEAIEEIELEEEVKEEQLSRETLFEEGISVIKEEIQDESLTEERIHLSEEIQEELNIFEEENKNASREELIEEVKEPPTNAAFIEYEYEVKEKNEYLYSEFDRMINFVNDKSGTDEERNSIIKNIIDTSLHLENISRKMSLEIISNIYQTITLSFEKISDGKYDISEGTINLFKKGLSLVISLIKGDDYFGYKDILKSIENIRNALLEEKQKRELYLKKQKEKQELEKKLSQKYPEDSQRVQIKMIKQLIKDTEARFNSLDKISGEYQIYEALRSLSGNLNNFKEIVQLSNELEMKKLVQLAEASYIFIKFLQNYRINPVTIEIKEIFGYIIYNLKSLVVDKTIEDIDLFISYLNDPVKIFSKTDKGKH